jgi:hypothetical protein
MTHQWLQIVGSTLPLLVLVGMTGCGGPYDASVSGKVSLDGNVVPRGTVAYQSVSGGPAAYGIIEQDGSYTIWTGREEGLPSGEYQVTVTATEPPTSEKSAKGGPPPPGKMITPIWYRTKETSGLKYTVESGGNEINLDLTSTPPPGWKQPAR